MEEAADEDDIRYIDNAVEIDELYLIGSDRLANPVGTGFYPARHGRSYAFRYYAEGTGEEVPLCCGCILSSVLSST